ncbi:MAG: GatB/YqeY domain-containing protein [Alphaproteobacteria bacterium]|nr:GatB/YqeY domain-containing protein [Alphaproteobacteria bacterium]
MRQQFNDAMKESMKSGDKPRLSTIRLILAAIKDRDIQARGEGKQTATDEELLQLLQKMSKQRADSIEQFGAANRQDLVDKETAEKAIIDSFLPKQMDAAETRAAIAGTISETGAAGMKDMGKVMGALKAKYAGTMDFSKANGVVKELLTAG